jgi:hypothetical protein
MNLDELYGHAESAKDALVDCWHALERAAVAPIAIANEPVKYWRVQAARRHYTVAKQHLDIVRRAIATGVVADNLLDGLLDPIDVFLENDIEAACFEVVRMVVDTGELLGRIVSERAGRERVATA